MKEKDKKLKSEIQESIQFIQTKLNDKQINNKQSTELQTPNQNQIQIDQRDSKSFSPSRSPKGQIKRSLTPSAQIQTNINNLSTLNQSKDDLSLLQSHKQQQQLSQESPLQPLKHHVKPSQKVPPPNSESSAKIPNPPPPQYIPSKIQFQNKRRTQLDKRLPLDEIECLRITAKIIAALGGILSRSVELNEIKVGEKGRIWKGNLDLLDNKEKDRMKDKEKEKEKEEKIKGKKEKVKDEENKEKLKEKNKEKEQTGKEQDIQQSKAINQQPIILISPSVIPSESTQPNVQISQLSSNSAT
ncbi:MAG: hypothetical protein EZS28_024314 [Streblomastix strix]|uniref:Uncharacterized protein n=1 Tax=Streblomastix strix TaxID=222440 RepID=A0A5J4VCA2_9EUKA|nr:MAG: hypothetical protein EZS28_024314 [Streblomastix strix]